MPLQPAMAAAINAYAGPPHIAAQGGWLAPVVPEGTRVHDILGRSLKWATPSGRRVVDVTKKLHATSKHAGKRAALLLKLHYWPKLLEAALKLEQEHNKKDAHRERQQQLRDALKLKLAAAAAAAVHAAAIAALEAAVAPAAVDDAAAVHESCGGHRRPRGRRRGRPRC